MFNTFFALRVLQLTLPHSNPNINDEFNEKYSENKHVKYK